MLRWLERHFGRFAIRNLTLYLVGGQAIFFFVGSAQPEVLEELVLIPQKVIEGEWWRLFVFLFMPPTMSLIFLFFALYLLYLFGNALENEWGTFRYNLYVLIAYVATIATVWVDPTRAATNVYITGSIFLAFAFLFPDFVLYLFFILPVKVKWLALLTWLMYGWSFITANNWLTRLLVLAAVSNFLLFFGRELVDMARRSGRRMKQQSVQLVDQGKPFHRCAACGKTDKSDPEMHFRYCPKCTGSPGYCSDHIFDHEHR